MNAVEFVIKLKDQLVAPMINAGSKTQSVFNQMNSGLRSLQQNYRNTGSSISQLNHRLDELKHTRELSLDLRQIREANREIQQLERRRDHLENTGRRNSGGGGGNSMMAGLASRFGPTALVAGGLMLGTSSVNAAMEAGVQKKSFETMAGKQQGGQLYDRLDKFARESIFGNDLMKDAQTMKAFGVETDRVMNRLERLGDISIGDSQKLNSLSLAYSQVFAGGKLTGQDNLQFINAGWNPLKELSQMSGKSMASLRKAMEEGKISISLIDKALEHATDKGGAFFEMTKKIGETSYGQLQGLKGNFEAFQKDLGNALMPLANDFVSLGNDVLQFLNISKSVPETLQTEKNSIDYLVGSITSLNEGNELRTMMLERLVEKYPDLFGNIDIEKTKNAELLSILNDINDAYDKKIANATLDYKIGKLDSEINQLEKDAVKWGAGDQSMLDRINYFVTGPMVPKREDLVDVSGAKMREAHSKKIEREKLFGIQQQDKQLNELQALAEQGNELLSNPKKQKELWGKNAAAKNKELQQQLSFYNNIQERKAQNALNNPWGQNATLEPALGPLKELLNPGNTKVKPMTPTPPSGGVDGFGDIGTAGDRADKVTAGGQKQIIITVNKFVDEINITNTGNGGVMGETEVERIFTEQFLRVLQSADQTGN